MKETDPSKMSNTEWERWACKRIATLEKDNEMMRDALDKLARLGNGDILGNSLGNKIAQEVLRVTGYLKEKGNE